MVFIYIQSRSLCALLVDVIDIGNLPRKSIPNRCICRFCFVLFYDPHFFPLPFSFSLFVLFFSFSLSFLFYSLSLSFSTVRSYLTHICVLNAGLSLSQLRQQASYLSRKNSGTKSKKLFSSLLASTPLHSSVHSLLFLSPLFFHILFFSLLFHPMIL